MKCLLGVENRESMLASLTMLKRLAPKDVALEIYHAVDVIRMAPGYGLLAAPDVPAGIVESLEKSAKSLLAGGQREACQSGFNTTTKIEWGPAAGSLLEEARKSDCELIAVHREQKSGIEQLVLGSVSRAVAIGARRSALITKGEIKRDGSISAVLAVDHSNYGDRCLKILDEFCMSGIRQLHIVTAFDTTKMTGSNDVESARTTLAEMNEQLYEKFRNKGIDATAVVVEGSPTRILHEAMESTGAELMIVGAQGHGFIDRLFLGSVSLHQVAAESYSVLLLRA